MTVGLVSLDFRFLAKNSSQLIASLRNLQKCIVVLLWITSHYLVLGAAILDLLAEEA